MAKRGRPKGSKSTTKPKAKGKRGRKAIFTEPQKRVLNRMIRLALKGQLRQITKYM